MIGALCMAFGASERSCFAANSAAFDSGATLAPVLVTAEKVRQDVRKVPGSVFVLGAEQLTSQHIQDVAELTRSVPNLSFSSQGGPGNQNIEIRGISSAAGSSTVAVYLDDVPLTVVNLDTQGQVEPSLLDIQRVEVLRGPQGTLYGASSEGGTIRYISNPVDLNRFEGRVGTDVSWTRHGGVNYGAKGTVNLPLIANELGLRLSLSTTSNSGYIDHYNPNDPTQLLQRGVNGNTWNAGTIALDWHPNSRLSIEPTLLFQKVKSDDLNVVDLGSADPLSQHKRVREWGNDTLTVPSITIHADLGFANLTSVTSYFDRYFIRQVDGTSYNSGYIGSLFDGAGLVGLDGNLDGYLIGNVASPVEYHVRTTQISQELRLSSQPYHPGGTPVTWIAGVWYSHQKIDSRDYETAPGLNATIATVYGSGALDSPPFLQALSGPPIPVFPNDAVYEQNKLYEITHKAVFGSATYHLTPSLRIAAGVRLSRESASLLRLGEFYFALGSPPAIKIASTGSAVTPRFSISYDASANTTVYAIASKGYRSGGPNRPLASFCPVEPSTFGPDSLWNYETGVKSRLLDDRLYVESDVFYIQWKDLQVDINLPCTFDYMTNAGSAASYGSELTVDFKPISPLTLSLSGGYTHATLTSDVPALAITSGMDVPGVPRWSASLSGRYTKRLGKGVEGFTSANWNYVGHSHGTVSVTDPDYNRPAYAVAGLSVGASYHDWQYSLFVQNLFDEQKIIQRPNLQQVNRGYTLRPRTIGFGVTTRF